MNFYPCNRHLLVRKLNVEEESKSAVLLPEDYKPKMSTYGYYELVADSSDCSLEVELGDILVAEESMVKEVVYNNEKYHLVQENYILGAFSEEE
jgi:co-chaperonin GroES (HSP10)